MGRPGRAPGARPDRIAHYHTRGAAVRVNTRGCYHRVFGPNWWGGHPHGRWGFYRRPWRSWWRPAAWTSVVGWGVWNWPSPIYYDYGGNVYYEENTVYVDGQAAGSAEQYAQQMGELANSVPQDVDPEQVEWLPLGVFALLKDDDDQDEPVMYLQLAVSKEGIIAGTYNNTVSDSTESLEGMVDKDTQRAVWTIGDNKNTVLETGVYNLTQEETPVLVHFGTEQTQQWLMVRMEEPPADEASP